MAKTKKEVTRKTDPIITQLNPMSEYARAAQSAFGCGLLHEFSRDGGTGVVEVHFVDGLPVRVMVRARKGDEDLNLNVRGVRAEWAVTLQQLGELFRSAAEYEIEAIQ